MTSMQIMVLHSFSILINTSGSVLQTHINLCQAETGQNIFASAWLCILFPSGKKLNGNDFKWLVWSYEPQQSKSFILTLIDGGASMKLYLSSPYKYIFRTQHNTRLNSYFLKSLGRSIISNTTRTDYFFL